MRKISEIPQVIYRTEHKRDASGKLVRYKKAIKVFKRVNSASSGERIVHYIVDAAIISGINYVLQLSLAPAILSGNVILFFFSSFFSLYFFAATVFYYFFCEAVYGVTVGKLLTGCIVVDEYGNKPGAEKAILRSLIRIIPFEWVSCIGTPSRGWHDRWSETYVIKRIELQKLLADIDGSELEKNIETQGV